MNRSKIHFALPALAAFVFMNSCAPWSTYPPVEKASKMVKPTYEPIPTVTAAAIQFAHEKYLGGADIAVNLPEGSPTELYNKVFAKLKNPRALQNPNEPAIHVLEIRTRDFNAQVDLIYPNRDGFNQLVTLTLRRSILENYSVVTERSWRIRDVDTPQPTYVQAVEPTRPE